MSSRTTSNASPAFYNQIISTNKEQYPKQNGSSSSPPILTSADVLGARFFHLSAEKTLEEKRQEESLKHLTKCNQYDKNCIFCHMVDLLKAQQK